MSMTWAIQIFLVQNRHMALGSTYARFFWHPFLKETDQELHLRAEGECAVVRVIAESMQCTGRSLPSSPHDML